MEINKKAQQFGTDNNPPNPYYIVTGSTLLDMNIKELPYLVDQLIPLSGVAALAGSSDTGKSTFLRQLAIAIAMGEKDFLGWKLFARYQRVLYISTEDDNIAMAHLLHTQVKGADPKLLDELLFIFDQEQLIEKIKKVISVKPVDLIVVDAFADVFMGDMNGVSNVRSYLSIYSAIAAKFNCMVIFLHHTGKRTESKIPSKSNLLGSQGFEAKMRIVFELRPDPIDPAFRHLCIVKGNYLGKEHKDRSFKLLFKDLTFINTGERVPFIQLVEQDAVLLEALQERICEMKSDDLSLREMESKLRSEGFKVGRTKIGELAKRCPEDQENGETPPKEDPEDDYLFSEDIV